MATLAQWSLLTATDEAPQDWTEALSACVAGDFPAYGAKLLWQRGIRDPQQLRGFLDPACYLPTSADGFEEMPLAVERLQQASDRHQKVAIWGDFDADGITATAVLWQGLGRIFPAPQLTYFIPNRLTESHGLSISGIDRLADWGAQLIVTCDTGSTHLAEIDYARHQGIDVIVSDHHTLPPQRPNVTALITPRTLPPEHPLATLSGVAVAYKLMEAVYQAWGQDLMSDLESMLDLVAIGLIADLVELKGDCRHLAQRGLLKLQTQLQPGQTTRPGVAELLTLCRRSGDRPSDIAFGLGPRINAVSRIHGDAGFCVELLTTTDPQRGRELAFEAELANTRRRALQRDLVQQVEAHIAQLDLGTTPVIVLADEQWQPGILGLVAGQVAQRYDRPTILLSLEPVTETPEEPLARGSARSVANLDLYQLFQAQASLLRSYGGHPMAAGLSLPVANLPLLRTALNRQVRELRGGQATTGPILDIDLTVTVAELGKALFQELKLLEPYGMGNPIPKLLVRDCWFEQGWHRKLKDNRGRKVGFVRTEFELWDATVQAGFPGEWWDHYRDDLPAGRCDAVVELDFNAYHRRYQVRLVAVRSPQITGPQTIGPQITAAPLPSPIPNAYPTSAEALPTLDPVELWLQLVGIAKYLSRTQQVAAPEQVRSHLGISPVVFELGLKVLAAVGFEIHSDPQHLAISGTPIDAPASIGVTSSGATSTVATFLEAAAEDQFRRRYWHQQPVSEAVIPS